MENSSQQSSHGILPHCGRNFQGTPERWFSAEDASTLWPSAWLMTTVRRNVKTFVRRLFLAASCLLLAVPMSPQELSKRLILKDGSYQSVTEWQIKGDRVRYMSAERDEWEEMPKDLVDWPATDKYNKEREAGAPTPEAVELDKQMAEERRADEAKSPHVAPGLRLPEDGEVELLDTFQGQPQLVELEQSSSDVNRNTKGNILRGVVNPVAGAKETIELPGLHAKIQAHAQLPAIYVNVAQQDQQARNQDEGPQPEQAELPWDRFRIVRAQVRAKSESRIVGNIKVAVYGKVSQDQKFVPTTAEKLTGGWVKVTPTKPLEAGEYAVVETLGKEGMNLYLWDFGVNPNAPANILATKPDPAENAPPEKPKEMQKR